MFLVILRRWMVSRFVQLYFLLVARRTVRNLEAIMEVLGKHCQELFLNRWPTHIKWIRFCIFGTLSNLPSYFRFKFHRKGYRQTLACPCLISNFEDEMREPIPDGFSDQEECWFNSFYCLILQESKQCADKAKVSVEKEKARICNQEIARVVLLEEEAHVFH